MCYFQTPKKLNQLSLFVFFCQMAFNILVDQKKKRDFQHINVPHDDDDSSHIFVTIVMYWSITCRVLPFRLCIHLADGPVDHDRNLVKKQIINKI